MYNHEEKYPQTQKLNSQRNSIECATYRKTNKAEIKERYVTELINQVGQTLPKKCKKS